MYNINVNVYLTDVHFQGNLIIVILNFELRIKRVN